MTELVRKNVNLLVEHPTNKQIYGAAESVADLKEKIRKSGRVTTITINSDNVIISGNRRVKACRELVAEGDKRFEELECEVKEFDSEEDELEYLVICNDMREKTVEQKAREAKTLMKIERVRAARRKKSGVKIDLPPTLAEGSDERNKGESSYIVSQKIGMKSGKEVSRSIAAVNKIDELEEQGKAADAELIRNELNHGSASAAEKLAKSIDILSDEDKQNIRDKKISVNKAVNAKLGKADNKKCSAKVNVGRSERNSIASDSDNDWGSSRFDFEMSVECYDANAADIEKPNEDDPSTRQASPITTEQITDDAIIVDEEGNVKIDEDKVIRVCSFKKTADIFPLDDDTRDHSDPKYSYIPRTRTVFGNTTDVKGSADVDITLIAEPKSFDDIYGILSEINKWFGYLTEYECENISKLMSSVVNDETMDKNMQSDFAMVFDDLFRNCGHLKWITNPICKQYQEKIRAQMYEQERQRNLEKQAKEEARIKQNEQFTHNEALRCVKQASKSYIRDKETVLNDLS